MDELYGDRTVPAEISWSFPARRGRDESDIGETIKRCFAPSGAARGFRSETERRVRACSNPSRKSIQGCIARAPEAVTYDLRFTSQNRTPTEIGPEHLWEDTAGIERDPDVGGKL